MCDETRDFRVPIDIDGRKMTMGDLYDLTPVEFISKVMLEEKVFETWHSGRFALLGDGKSLSHILWTRYIATYFQGRCLILVLYFMSHVFIACHKLHPNGGQGKFE